MKKLTVEMNFNSKELFYVYKKASKFGNKNLRYDELSPLMLVIKKNTDSVKEKFKKIKKQINIYENSKPITAQEKKSWPKRIKNLYREFIKMIKMVNKEFVMNLISKKESKYIFDKMRIVYNLKKDNKFLDMKIYEIFKRKFKGSEPFLFLLISF